MQTKISFLFAALFVLCACNSSTVESGDLGPHDDGTGTQSDMQSDSPTDAPVASDAPQNGPCGVCGETEVCVVPCCGGASGDMGCTPESPFCAPDSILATCSSGGTGCAQCSVGGGHGIYDSSADTVACVCS